MSQFWKHFGTTTEAQPEASREYEAVRIQAATSAVLPPVPAVATSAPRSADPDEEHRCDSGYRHLDSPTESSRVVFEPATIDPRSVGPCAGQTYETNQAWENAAEWSHWSPILHPTSHLMSVPVLMLALINLSHQQCAAQPEHARLSA